MRESQQIQEEIRVIIKIVVKTKRNQPAEVTHVLLAHILEFSHVLCSTIIMMNQIHIDLIINSTRETESEEDWMRFN